LGRDHNGGCEPSSSGSTLHSWTRASRPKALRSPHEGSHGACGGRARLRPHLALFAAIGRVHPQILQRTLPLNGAGVCGAVLCDLRIPSEILRGVSLLARRAGLLGQIAEEIRNPVGSQIYLGVEHHAYFQASQTPLPPLS
ncbi:MAG: hypothetical protein ACP5O0_11130, partial [Acidimicrobiales bacterium]